MTRSVPVCGAPDCGSPCTCATAPEKIHGLEELDPRRYGVIVQRGWRRGLLLPDIPGIEDAATQVRYARMKAGIGPDEPVELERFCVEKYT